MMLIGIVSLVVLAVLIARSGACDPSLLAEDEWDTDAAFPEHEGLREVSESPASFVLDKLILDMVV